MLTLRALVGLLALAAVAAGCETMPWQGASPRPVAELDDSDDAEDSGFAPSVGLALSSEQRFPDLPLPVGVEEDPERTYVFESAELQVGRMVYTTRATANQLAQFYIEECPAADWSLKNRTWADGVELEFTKPGKRLVVTVRNEGRERILVLNLTPEVGL